MLISGGTDKLLTLMMKVSAILILVDSGVTLTPLNALKIMVMLMMMAIMMLMLMVMNDGSSDDDDGDKDMP